MSAAPVHPVRWVRTLSPLAERAAARFLSEYAVYSHSRRVCALRASIKRRLRRAGVAVPANTCTIPMLYTLLREAVR